MRAYVFASLIRNALTLNGYHVKQTQNFTDVGHLTSDSDSGEDKLQKAAAKQRKSAWEIAKQFIDFYFTQHDLLGLPRAEHYPLATDYISEQIEMVEALEKEGFTYTISDGVYFDTAKFERYGELAKLDIEGLSEGIRVSNSEKRNKTDFALWKFSPKDEQRDMEWDSPWGLGFPGWHIECSAMAKATLGDQIDIHTGGIDHIHVHHSAEIAQSEALCNQPFSKFWMHVNFLQIEAEPDAVLADEEKKMSKSKGNVITVDALIEKGYSPMALKYLYYTAHYSRELKFSMKAMDSAQKTLMGLYKKSYEIRQRASIADVSDTYDEMGNAFNLNLNTPVVIAHLHEGLASRELSDSQKLGLLDLAEQMLGLGLLDYMPETVDVPSNINQIAEKRIIAKQNKDWALADKLRDDALSKGYRIIDTGSDMFEIEVK